MLLVNIEKSTFNTAEIQRGTLVCAKHQTWEEGQPGIVTDVSEDLIRVQYLPFIKNVLNHYFIPVSEVVNGEWEIRYSPDGLESVLEYPLAEEEEDLESGGDLGGSE